MISDDADAGEAPRRRPRRRRRKKNAADEGRQPVSSAEASAFEDPPPLDGEREKGSGSARKRRTRRRRRGAPREASAEGAMPPAGGSEDSSEESEAARDEASGETATERPRGRRRKRARRRRSTSGGREPAGSDETAAAAEGDVPPLPDEADEPPPADDSGAKRGRRRRRGRRRKEGDDESAASGAPEAAEGEEDGESRPRSRRKGRSGRRDRSEKREGKGRRERKEGRDRKDGRERRESRERKRERGTGRERRRDPRAIDIVPRAPTAEERAKEKVLLVNARDREEARIALLVDGRLEEVYIEAASSERSSAGNIYRGRVQNVERGIGAAFVDLGRGLTGFLHASDLPVTGDEDRKAPVTERLQAGDEVIVQITRDSIGRKGPALTGRISFPGRYLVLMPFTARSGISRRIPQGPERERVRKLLRKLEVPEGMGVIVRTASETTDLAALQADLDHLLREWEFIRRKAAEPGQPGMLRGESDLAERSVRDIMPGDVSRIVVDRDDIAGRIHRLLRVWYPSAAAAAEEAAHVHARAATAARDTPLGELAPPSAEDATAGAEGAPPGTDAGSEDAQDQDEPGEDAPSEIDVEACGPTEDGPGEPDETLEDEPADEPVDAPDEEREDSDPEETPEEHLARLERVARAMPEVELHTEDMPLFHRFGAETQLEDAFRRSTRLPSGGSIVIDPTEALVAVDVNSGRLTDEVDPESTALVTNLEAVEEAARQLRLRDLGGLVVIDFIDMRDRKSRRKVELALREALSGDRARIRMGRMGPFGLVVLSRQRIRQALSRVTHDPCVTCGGTGRRRQVSGLGLRVLREIQARISRSRGRGGLEVRAPAEVVTWIKKNRGQVLKQLTKACSGPISLEADARLAVDGWAMKGLPPAQ